MLGVPIPVARAGIRRSFRGHLGGKSATGARLEPGPVPGPAGAGVRPGGGRYAARTGDLLAVYHGKEKVYGSIP